MAEGGGGGWNWKNVLKGPVILLNLIVELCSSKCRYLCGSLQLQIVACNLGFANDPGNC